MMVSMTYKERSAVYCAEGLNKSLFTCCERNVTGSGS